MKKLALVFGMFLVAGVVLAKENPAPVERVGVMQFGTTLKVFYKGVESNDVKVSIYDESNRLIYKETIRKVDGFIRPYNLSQLSKGNYTVEVIDGDVRELEHVAI
jgi:hypothetical protein